MSAIMQRGARARKMAKMPEFIRSRMDDHFINRLQNEWGGDHLLKGAVPQPGAIEMISNDYLGLSNHPRIVAAQVGSLQSGDKSVVMSGAFLKGDNNQRRFEQRCAEWTGYEAAILCQSGYAANVGLIQSIAGADIPVYVDMSGHASLWEGVNSANGRAIPFRHNDMKHLARQVRQHGQGVICVDSVYSTSGTICPLEELVALAEETGCVLIVDESHSLGTHGPDGAGLVAAAGLQERVHFVTASLAKSFSGRAGLVLCSGEFADYFWVTSLPAIFSSCLLDHEILALDATLELIQREHWRREAVQVNADFLRRGLAELGYNVTASQSQIIALEAGTERSTQKLRMALEQRGVFGSVFCAPATPKNRSLVRFSVNALLTLSQLQRVLAVCAEIRDDVDMWEWPSTRRLARVQPEIEMMEQRKRA